MTVVTYRSLPFFTEGTIKAQDGSVLEIEVPVSVWPSDGRNADAGRTYDHEGECPDTYADLLMLANRSIEINGTSYRIVQATHHQFFPHVSLLLRESRTGG